MCHSQQQLLVKLKLSTGWKLSHLCWIRLLFRVLSGWVNRTIPPDRLISVSGVAAHENLCYQLPQFLNSLSPSVLQFLTPWNRAYVLLLWLSYFSKELSSQHLPTLHCQTLCLTGNPPTNEPPNLTTFSFWCWPGITCLCFLTDSPLTPTPLVPQDHSLSVQET